MRKGGNEKMKNKFVLIRYVLMLWMLCGAFLTHPMASAATRTPQYASWGYQPLHSVAASAQVRVIGSGSGCAAGGGYSSATYRGTGSAAGTAVAMPSLPTYTFRTTSAYVPASRGGGEPVVLAEGAAYSSPFDPTDEDDPIGTVTPQPVGDAPWLLLLLLVAGYVLFPPMRAYLRYICGQEYDAQHGA